MMRSKPRGKQWVRVYGAPLQAKPAVTNQHFANTNEEFQQACERANVKVTARQASKFRNGYGAAFRAA